MTETTRTFTVRSETDVLALVPYTFGFHPRESLVMLALTSSGRPFHARVDLPARVEDVGDVVDLLVQPAVTNRAERVLLVAYTAVEALAAACLSALEEALDGHGVATLMTLRVDGDAWCHVGREGDRGGTRHHDLTAHALTSEGVLEGKVTYASREELRASVEVVDPARAAALAAAHRRLPPLTRTQRTVLGSEGRWLLAQLAEHLAREDSFDPVTGARVVRALDVPALRDLAWCRMTRAEGPAYVRLWEPLVQGCPESLVASPAAVLGFAAWLSGHGALAWCAVDRSLRAHPGHSLARLVSDLLDAALPPSRWEPVDPCALALMTG